LTNLSRRNILLYTRCGASNVCASFLGAKEFTHSSLSMPNPSMSCLYRCCQSRNWIPALYGLNPAGKHGRLGWLVPISSAAETTRFTLSKHLLIGLLRASLQTLQPGILLMLASSKRLESSRGWRMPMLHNGNCAIRSVDFQHRTE
jgi:hypothetical protein